MRLSVSTATNSDPRIATPVTHRAGIGRWVKGLAVVALAMAASPALAQQAQRAPDAEHPAALVGEYVHSQMELAAGILLNADGTFLYGLTVGSLDERAQGRWAASGDRIAFTSDPRPVAPTITAGTIDGDTGQPFAIRVLTPRGDDMPGVDFTIAFDNGEPLEGHMLGEPWSFPEDESRTPRSVTFEMPGYRLRSEPMPLDRKDGTTANFILTPNDFGVADLTGAHADIEGETLTLHHPSGGRLSFRRIER